MKNIKEFSTSKPTKLELLNLDAIEKAKRIIFPQDGIELYFGHEIKNKSYACNGKRRCKYCKKGISKYFYVLYPAIDLDEMKAIVIKGISNSNSTSLSAQFYEQLKRFYQYDGVLFLINRVNPKQILITKDRIPVDVKEAEELTNFNVALNNLNPSDYFSA